MIQLLNQLSDIPNESYQGYVWYSDRVQPITLIDEHLPEWPGAADKHFVVEALLYDSKAQRSYQVVHTGRLIIQSFNWQQLPEEVVAEEHAYLPYRLDPRVAKLRFVRLWQPQADPYCDGAEVLRPVAWIFRGFDIAPQ